MTRVVFRIGMDKQNLWTIEKGKSNPQILTLVKIASGLTITLPILLKKDNYITECNQQCN